MDSLKPSVEGNQKHTNEELYHKQVELLRTFLDRNAISKEQYEKSYHDLTEKMGMTPTKENMK